MLASVRHGEITLLREPSFPHGKAEHRPLQHSGLLNMPRDHFSRRGIVEQEVHVRGRCRMSDVSDRTFGEDPDKGSADLLQFGLEWLVVLGQFNLYPLERSNSAASPRGRSGGGGSWADSATQRL